MKKCDQNDINPLLHVTIIRFYLLGDYWKNSNSLYRIHGESVVKFISNYLIDCVSI